MCHGIIARRVSLRVFQHHRVACVSACASVSSCGACHCACPSIIVWLCHGVCHGVGQHQHEVCVTACAPASSCCKCYGVGHGIIVWRVSLRIPGIIEWRVSLRVLQHRREEIVPLHLIHHPRVMCVTACVTVLVTASSGVCHCVSTASSCGVCRCVCPASS